MPQVAQDSPSKALEIAKTKRTNALLFAQSLQKKLRENHASTIEVSYEK